MTSTSIIPISEINFNAIISKGWEVFKKYWPTLLGYTVLIIVAHLLMSGIGAMIDQESAGLSLLFQLISGIVSLLVGMAYIYVLILAAEGKTITLETVFSRSHRIVSYLLGNILLTIVLMVGFILLIVPGIYFSIKYTFVPYLLIHKNIGVFESFSMSAKMTKGRKWQLFLYTLGFVGINIIGLLVLGVGLLITVPVSSLAFVVLYLSLVQTGEGDAATTEIPVQTNEAGTVSTETPPQTQL
ncbi:MAG: DUF975 family protein [Patescibacteria group bacterium]